MAACIYSPFCFCCSRVAVRTLPGLVDYHPMQFHCCINLYWLYHCCSHLLPVLLFVCVALCILPGSVDYDPMQFHCCINLYCLYHGCLHLLPVLLLLFACGCPHFTWLGWLSPHAISLLHKFVLVVSLLRAFTPRLALAVRVWLSALYLACLTTTPFNFIAA